MRFLWIALIVTLMVLTGCQSEAGLSVENLGEADLDETIRHSFDQVDENGAHLFYGEEDDVFYVYLNGANVQQGESATHFTEFDVDSDGDTLNLNYNSEETDDYDIESLDYEAFYKVSLDQEYETFLVFENGEEVPLGTVIASK